MKEFECSHCERQEAGLETHLHRARIHLRKTVNQKTACPAMASTKETSALDRGWKNKTTTQNCPLRFQKTQIGHTQGSGLEITLSVWPRKLRRELHLKWTQVRGAPRYLAKTIGNLRRETNPQPRSHSTPSEIMPTNMNSHELTIKNYKIHQETSTCEHESSETINNRTRTIKASENGSIRF